MVGASGVLVRRAGPGDGRFRRARWAGRRHPWAGPRLAPMRAYLDHAATTPLLDCAREAMVAALGATGNASSLHSAGRAARRRVEESRESIAAAVGVAPSEVVFTSGGTEADNLAVKGLWWARTAGDPRRRRVLASRIEHHAVLDPVLWLADHEGAEIVWLDVDAVGRVDPAQVAAELAADPDGAALVAVMWANNEVGTVQPIAELAQVCGAAGVPLHVDAVQAFGSSRWTPRCRRPWLSRPTSSAAPSGSGPSWRAGASSSRR